MMNNSLCKNISKFFFRSPTTFKKTRNFKRKPTFSLFLTHPHLQVCRKRREEGGELHPPIRNTEIFILMANEISLSLKRKIATKYSELFFQLNFKFKYFLSFITIKIWNNWEKQIKCAKKSTILHINFRYFLKTMNVF